MDIIDEDIAHGVAAMEEDAAIVDPDPVYGGRLHGRPWTGGSRDPVQIQARPRSVYCYRDPSGSKYIQTRVEKGVGDAYKLRVKTGAIPVPACEAKIISDLLSFGMDSVFWVQDDDGAWFNVARFPDRISVADLRAHEAWLMQECPYNVENLSLSRIYIERSMEAEILVRLTNEVNPEDGGPVLWQALKRVTQGSNTSKLLKAQQTIMKTQLKDFPGLDVVKYHNELNPALRLCHDTNHLPLNVGPTVIANHAGPKSRAYDALIGIYASEQATLHDSARQYERLVPQMNSMREIYLNDSEWEMVEAPKGSYLAGNKSTLTQEKKETRRCYKCKQVGHLKANCPNKKKKKSTSGLTQVRTVMAKSRKNNGTIRTMRTRPRRSSRERHIIGVPHVIMDVESLFCISRANADIKSAIFRILSHKPLRIMAVQAVKL